MLSLNHAFEFLQSFRCPLLGYARLSLCRFWPYLPWTHRPFVSRALYFSISSSGSSLDPLIFNVFVSPMFQSSVFPRFRFPVNLSSFSLAHITPSFNKGPAHSTIATPSYYTSVDSSLRFSFLQNSILSCNQSNRAFLMCPFIQLLFWLFGPLFICFSAILSLHLLPHPLQYLAVHLFIYCSLSFCAPVLSLLQFSVFLFIHSIVPLSHQFLHLFVLTSLCLIFFLSLLISMSPTFWISVLHFFVVSLRPCLHRSLPLVIVCFICRSSNHIFVVICTTSLTSVKPHTLMYSPILIVPSNFYLSSFLLNNWHNQNLKDSSVSKIPVCI